MVRKAEREEINKLFKAGISVPQISKTLERSTTTIYRLLKSGKSKTSQRNQISRFEKYLRKQIKKGVTNRRKLLLELQEKGYKGSYSSLYQHLKSLPIKHRDYKPAIRFETGPGEQAQVDWGHFGKIEINGKIERLSCFVYVLGYSRAMYVEFVVKQNLRTLQQCHINAFEKLGVPKEIVYDNMKTVVEKIERLPNHKIIHHLNPAFVDFADYYDFKINPCNPYHPREKGKVEAAVKFVRHNFMQGMKFKSTFKSLDDLNEQAKRWLDNLANVRLHGTTEKRPIDLWKKEKLFLRFSRGQNYPITIWSTRNSTKDGIIEYKSNAYPIPTEYARRKLDIGEKNKNGIAILEIYFEDELIAKYNLSSERNKWLQEKEAIVFKLNSRNNTTKREKQFKSAESKNTNNLPSLSRREISYYNHALLKQRGKK